jgi:glycosidase
MRLVLDMVLNHTSDQHPWFREALRRQDSQERDFYIVPARSRQRRASAAEQLAIDDWSARLAS